MIEYRVDVVGPQQLPNQRPGEFLPEEFLFDEECLFETWRNLQGQRHRLDGPALIARYKDGRIVGQLWYVDGLLHRDDGPARITSDGYLQEQQWYRNGLLHRDRGSSRILERIDQQQGPLRLSEQWMKAGRPHRIGGPNSISIDLHTGVIDYEDWRVDGKAHRTDGPSTIERDRKTGIVTLERWEQNDLLHRLDGPAYIERDGVTRAITDMEYFTFGRKVPAPQPPSPRLG